MKYEQNASMVQKAKKIENIHSLTLPKHSNESFIPAAIGETRMKHDPAAAVGETRIKHDPADSMQ